MRKIALILVIPLLIFFSALVYAGGASPSGKTAANLITEVRYFLNESPASFWTDAEILSWINDAVQNINLRNHILEDSQIFTLSTGTTEYELATYLSVKGVLYQSGATAFRSLFKGKIEEIGHKDTEFAEPRYWYEFDGKVGVYPLQDTRDATSTGNTIYVLTVPIADTLISTSAIPTPALFDRAIVYYATAQALMKDRQFGYANQFLTQYFSELDRIRIDISDSEKSIWDIIIPKQPQR